MTRRFLMGNEAFAYAALEAGCGLFAGYPGTPSSEVIETVAKLVADGTAQGVHVEWSTNEKAALEVAAAASLAGMRAMVTCKQVGLNVASDALMSLNYLGVKGGLVILVADDPGPISSQTEQDTRRFAAFAKVPVLDPATPEQGFAMIGQAFQLSERYGTPVIFRPTTRIDHASTFMDTADATRARSSIGGGFERDPEEYVIFPPRAYRAHGQINDRLRSIAHDFRFDPQLSAFNPLFANAQGSPKLVTETTSLSYPAPSVPTQSTGLEEEQMAQALPRQPEVPDDGKEPVRAAGFEAHQASGSDHAFDRAASASASDHGSETRSDQSYPFGEYDELAESDYFDTQLLPADRNRFHIKSERFSFPRFRAPENEKPYSTAGMQPSGKRDSGTFYPLHNLADDEDSEQFHVDAQADEPGVGDGAGSDPLPASLSEGGVQQQRSEQTQRAQADELASRNEREQTVQAVRTVTIDPETGSFYAVAFDDDDTDPRAPFARLGIVCGGVSTQYAREALRLLERTASRLGRQLPPLRLLQIGTPYPFPRRIATRALRDLTDVLVLEELDSVIEEELQRMASASFLWPRIHGKLSGEANDRGENSTEDALARIASFLDSHASAPVLAPSRAKRRSAAKGGAQELGTVSSVSDDSITYAQLAASALNSQGTFQYPASLPPRPAVLCAGCPHRASFLTVKHALKELGIKREGAVFCGDIGCYTLGNAVPLDAVDTCLCMGGGITMAQGIAAADPSKKAIAFVGDSTFFASGMTGIVNAAYNQHDVTICVLDNATTAMTGLQPHPGTGLTLMGQTSERVSIKAMLKAANITHIAEVDPLDGERAEEAMVEALSFKGPSAVIFKSACIWTKPFDIPATVNPNKCTGCRKCVTQVGCPAIGFDVAARGAKSGRRGQAVIDHAQCNGCGLCLSACPFDAIDITPEVESTAEGVRMQTPPDQGSLPSQSADMDGSSRRGADRSDAVSENIASIGEPVDMVIGQEELSVDDTEAPGSFKDAEHVDSDAVFNGFAGAALASERLSRIRSGVPIIPMTPFGMSGEGEDDELYADMTAHRQQRVREQPASGPVRVIRPQGERHYFMKEALQRGAAARMFAHTSSGIASQQAQLSLTGVAYFTRSQESGDVDMPSDAPRSESKDAQVAPSRPVPDYGGNTELSLDALFGEREESAPFTYEEAEALSQTDVAPDTDAEHPAEFVDAEGFAFSFDGVALDMDQDTELENLRGHGRRSSTRAVKRIEPKAEPEDPHADEEDAAARSQEAHPRQIRSRFADYGRSSQGPSPSSENPWGGRRR